MRMLPWLTNLHRKLLKASTCNDFRGRQKQSLAVASIVQRLESRQLLSNQPPLVTLNAPTPVAYTAPAPPVAIASNALVSDPDSTYLSKLTVQITTGYQNDSGGHDVLSLDSSAQFLVVSNSFDATTGTLTLTGQNTVSIYRSIIRAVEFSSSGPAVNAGMRTFTVIATDYAPGSTPASSAPVSCSANVSVDAAPVLSQIEANPLNDVGSTPVFVTASLIAADSDNSTLPGATIKVSGNYQNGEDVLGFVNTANIAGSWHAATGTLTLTGVDTVANYNTALHSVTFQDSNSSPNTATRTISFQAFDTLQGSNVVTRDVTVKATATSPVFSGVNGTTNFVQNSSAVAIAPNLVVTSLNLTGATVSFTNWQGEDRVSFTNTYAFQHTFTQDLTAHTALLTITGNGTASQYQTVLRSVVYSDAAGNPNTSATRLARFAATDINSNSGAGTQSVTVTAVDRPPVVTVNDSSVLTYTAPGPAIAVFGNGLVTDPDSTYLSELTVQITAGYQNDSGGHDVLALANPNQFALVSHAFDPATGTLDIIGQNSVSIYRNILRAVEFSSSGSSVSNATRTFTVVAFDYTYPNTPASSGPVSRNVTVTVDAAPVLSQIEANPLNVIGNAAVSVTASLVAADSDNSTLPSATIKVSGNYQNGEDVLGFANTSNISGSWNAATGTLTLTGVDTVVNYNTALRNVTFRDTSASPNSATRTISFQVFDALQGSNVVSRNVTVQATANSPVVSGVNGTTNFAKNSSPVSIAPNLVITSLNLTAATVSFTNWQGEDRVNFSNTYAFQHTFTQDLTAHTALLTITGNGTASQFQTLLRSVVYSDVAGNPNVTATRHAIFSVTDINSHSGTGTQNITVTAADSPPVVTVNDSTPLAYLSPGPAIAIFGNGLVTDPDSSYLSELTVQITAGYQNNSSGHDILSLDNPNQFALVSHTFDPTTGTLTIIGQNTVSIYRNILRAVEFSTSGSAVNTATRTFTVVAFDYTYPNTPASSSPVSRNVTVSVDAAPALSQIEANPLSVIGTSPTPVTGSLMVSDSDNANLTGATIKISGNYQSGEDVLGFINTANITGSWNSANGTLSLTGIDSVANYNAALKNVTYQNTSTSPNTAATRTIGFQVTDGLVLSNLVTRDLTARATATSPVLSGINGSVNFVEKGAAVAIAPNLVVTSLGLTSATVSFTNWQGEDRVSFTNTYALQHTFTQDLVAHTALLTITGSATASQYQTLLRSVIYSDVSANPITSVTRVAKFTLTDVNSSSGSGVQDLTVTAINDPPIVAVNDSTALTYQANGAAIAIMSNALISDADSTNLSKLTIQITSGYQNNGGGNDVLSFVNQLGIAGSFNAVTGTLTLSGLSSVGNYRQALRQVMFNTSGSVVSTTTRTFTIIATDDTNTNSNPVTRNMTITS